MIKVTEEMKAVLDAERGRIVGFVKSDEPRKISLAVPGDRAVMTPAQARALAAWLVEEAAKAERERAHASGHTAWLAAEAEHRALIKRALRASDVW